MTLLACITMLSGVVTMCSAADYYVATDGNDASAGTLDAPFATIERAQEAVRETERRPLTVEVRAGVYRIREALVFGPEDSGIEGAPVTWAAYPGEQPVISGGMTVGGWKQGPGKLWQTKITAVQQGAHYFRQLFVNGERRTRARHPNEGYLRTAGPMPGVDPREGRKDRDAKFREGFQYREGDLQQWDNFEDVTVYLYHSWTRSVHHFRELDEENRIAHIQPHTGWPVGYWERTQRYRLDNFFEALDQPGEWYLDRTTGVLRYWPLPGEDMTKVEVIAPVVTGDLLTLRGEEGNPVEHVAFEGLSFQHADWEGMKDGQSVNWARGAITTEWARDIRMEDCEVAHVGSYGIWLGEGSQRCTVQRCEIHDLGAGGVKIGETGPPDVPERREGYHVVDNCFLHDGGHVYRAGCGVLVLRTSFNHVTNNDICDFYYTGVSVGWSWGYAETSAHDNAIEYNHIHDIGKADLSDMGGIYCLGDSPGTTLRHNHIHDVYAYAYGGWGLYTDEGSTGILLESNIVHDTKSGGFHQHYGKDNTIRNNIFAWSMDGQINRSRQEEHQSFDFRGNIVLTDNGEPLSRNWGNGNYTIGENMYWDTSDREPYFAGMPFADWQGLGRDEGSVIEDPLFVDAEGRDFTLKPDSPALAMGFEPIDAGEIGLYGDAEWVALPTKIVREAFDIPPVTLPLRPGPIVDGFEETKVGERPELTVVSGEEQGASIRVTDELASEGARCLKFTDMPGLARTWQPHMYYRPNFLRGVTRVSFDVRLGEGAILWHEWRNSGGKYDVGPSLKLIAGGELQANGKTVGTVPMDEWLHVEIVCGLGAQSTHTYDLTVTAPGQAPVELTGLAWGSDEFLTLNWLGFISIADADVVWYLDNVSVTNEQYPAQ
jgi:hypothetical protein